MRIRTRRPYCGSWKCAMCACIPMWLREGLKVLKSKRKTPSSAEQRKRQRFTQGSAEESRPESGLRVRSHTTSESPSRSSSIVDELTREFRALEEIDSLPVERRLTNDRKDDYNHHRRRSLLGSLAPATFAACCAASTPEKTSASPPPSSPFLPHSGSSLTRPSNDDVVQIIQAFRPHRTANVRLIVRSNVFRPRMKKGQLQSLHIAPGRVCNNPRRQSLSCVCYVSRNRQHPLERTPNLTVGPVLSGDS